jgi:tetratricopeptide (TPR) repeat protein
MISAVSLFLPKISRRRRLILPSIVLLAACISLPCATAQSDPNLASRISEDLRQVRIAEKQQLSNKHRGFLWGTLAADYRDAADFNRSEDAYNHAINLLKTSPRAAINYATALDNLGALYLVYGHNEEAADCMKKALAVRRQLGMPVHLAMSLQHLADLDISLHKFKDAEKEALQAYQILVAANASQDNDIAVLASLAYSRCKLNNCALGIQDAQHAFDIAQATIPHDSLQFGLTLVTLGYAQSRTNQIAAGESSILAGLQIVKTHIAPGDPTYIYSLAEYRDFLKFAHRDSEAKQIDSQLANFTARLPCATCSVNVYSLSNAMR